MLRYFTAGESHGPCLTAIIDGVPAGFPIDVKKINHDLWRRQQGYGRGGRMLIEKDEVQIRSGIRWGETLGSPVALGIENRDWKNWTKKMSVSPEDRDEALAVTKPRPGHADLTGVLKYRHSDIRNILERASARDTVSRTAVGSFCKQLLAPFGIKVMGYIRSIGKVEAKNEGLTYEEIFARSDESPVRVADKEAEDKMIALIEDCKKKGDTLGGIFEVVALGLPPGLGSHAQWDDKLDGRLARALMSIQAIKGVEIGLGFEMARRRGSEVHDEIFFDPDKMVSQGTPRIVPTGFYRGSNNSGGTEGGMSNGAPLVVRVAMKPISTLMSPLQSVDLRSKRPADASVERSDVCSAPAAAVVGEAVVAFELAVAFLEKFGGDSLHEITRNYEGYLGQIKNF
ncbi:MAG: chorismate synthase [Deltaproteobacteria bacterium RIFCSPLOWO2_02_56_12]|nr:MAG: chorismate synthase [Deltaproteobacteria bacterium RIFCSPLOWO2_02_56_12]